MSPSPIYTIAPHLSFLDTLVAGIFERYGDTPEALADITIFLPRRRACRALQEAFLRMSNGRPLILPRMIPLGDMDALSFLSDQAEMLSLSSAFEDLPPPLSPLMQRLLLTRLLAEKTAHKEHAIEHYAQLAMSLATLLTELETAGISREALTQIVPDTLAHHWQEGLELLNFISEQWPEILHELHALDPAEYRHQLLTRQALLWRETLPKDPVIVAGSLGSIPATHQLIATIATLPQGYVIVPGVDLAMDEVSWKVMDPCHPQFMVKRLLSKLGTTRGQLVPWTPAVRKLPVRPQRDQMDLFKPSPPPEVPRSPRHFLISEMMRPSATSNIWYQGITVPEGACNNLYYLTHKTLQDEAETIACIMREALETKGRTAVLVTETPALIERVITWLKRFDITCNHSRGMPLSSATGATYLLLLAEMVTENCLPIPLLAWLKHPLTTAGYTPGQFRHHARLLERVCLRGVRANHGLDGLIASVTETEEAHILLPWLNTLKTLLTPFLEAMALPKVPFTQLLRTHLQVAEHLAAIPDALGDTRLFAGDEGHSLHDFFTELLHASDTLPAINPSSYVSLLHTLMAGYKHRPRFGTHPRLHILTPEEARLLRFDVVIIAGLNEGEWPGGGHSDPWLSGAMREQIGLPPQTEQIGRAAHDLFCLLHAETVVLSRAEKQEGTPTVPSRWLLRLETVLQGLSASLSPPPPWQAWAAHLTKPQHVTPLKPPMPTPPLEARPATLSVTNIERLMRDPYSIYARYVLKLRALDPIDADPDAATFGTLLHEAFDRFYKQLPSPFTEETALALLLQIGDEVLKPYAKRPVVSAFWRPRFARIAEWFITQDAPRIETIRHTLTEMRGSWAIPLSEDKSFKLQATADRIDVLHDGRCVILDYKTGHVPSTKEIAAGLSPQLPLEAVIARHGGFKDVPALSQTALSYVRLTGTNPPGEWKEVKKAETYIDDAEQGLIALIRHFHQPDTPYLACPDPTKAPAYSDYAHLERMEEWS